MADVMMTTVDVGLLVFAVLAWLGVGLLAAATRFLHHDEIFLDAIPGTIPPPGRGLVGRLRGTSREYNGEIAVAFSPPRGVTPGLVGTVIDGRVDSRDLTATLVDLAVRGHLQIEAVEVDAAPHAARGAFARRPDAAIKTDWIVRHAEADRGDVMDRFEAALVDGLLAGRREVRMSQLDYGQLQALREAELALYRQVVDRRWYPRHPQQRGGSGLLLIGGACVGALLCLAAGRSVWALMAGALLVGAAVVASRVLRGRTPRTAEGSAVRIQALGFKTYLATAEADQFKFEEAQGIFSRYLPYAMALGVAQHWAKVFGDVARSAAAQGQPVDYDLDWFVADAVMDSALDLLWWDSLDGHLDLLEGLSTLGEWGVDGVGEAAQGLGEMVGGLGEFMGSLDFMDADGVDGCGEGCSDVGGCLDF